ncbi:MAG: class I SAM-dependent methyltransferase [Gammaproteobacteria bacterium]|nr:class I SAM-dependent methyltransferase [Gammaproteobacteria bacterium]
MTKSFAPAYDRNKHAILAVLQEILPRNGVVLEVGSGTGQHAMYFAQNLPHITWIPSDRAGEIDSIEAWRAESGLANLRAPLEIDLYDEAWPVESVDAIVCINVVHIAPWTATEKLFITATGVLRSGGLMYLYGPYRYATRPLEPSNEAFDQWLKARDADSGIRDFESLNELAGNASFQLLGDRSMPANNRSLWWRKT